MIACVDLDGTISADPEFYRSELRGLMERHHQVHVLTGNPDAPRTLASLGLQKGRHYTTVVTVPKKRIARFKVAYMRHVGSTQLIDNRGKNCKAAQKAGFTAHHHMRPKAPEEG